MRIRTVEGKGSGEGESTNPLVVVDSPLGCLEPLPSGPLGARAVPVWAFGNCPGTGLRGLGAWGSGWGSARRVLVAWNFKIGYSVVYFFFLTVDYCR